MFNTSFPALQSKHQKHQAFEAELQANADRIRGVIDVGNSLIDRGACAGSEDAVKVSRHLQLVIPVCEHSECEAAVLSVGKITALLLVQK